MYCLVNITPVVVVVVYCNIGKKSEKSLPSLRFRLKRRQKTLHCSHADPPGILLSTYTLVVQKYLVAFFRLKARAWHPSPFTKPPSFFLRHDVDLLVLGDGALGL